MKAQQFRKRRQNEQLHDYLVSLMPLISEANSMSEELEKGCHFELKIVSQDVFLGHGQKFSNVSTIGNSHTQTDGS